VWLSKQLKQIIQIKHSIVKNPNWPEANQLATYKRGQGFELGVTMKQIQVVVGAGIEPGTAVLRVQCADHSAMLPPIFAQSMYTEYKLTCRADSQDVENKMTMHSIPLNLCASFRSVGNAGAGT